MSLPTGASLFHVYIPASIVDPNEIKTVVMTEARHVIPVPIQDVDIDWLSIPDEILPKINRSNKRYFLLIAVSHESPRRYESYMNAANIHP